MNNQNETMTCMNCDCLKETPGKTIVPYINMQRSTITNIVGNRPLATILKGIDERLCQSCLVTKNKTTTLIRIYFTATVKLTSVTIRTTCKKMLIYKGDNYCDIDWRKSTPYEELELNNHFMTAHCAKNKQEEITKMMLVLEGDEGGNTIHYLDIKGSFVREKQQPVIAKYEVYATEVEKFEKNVNAMYLV